MIKLRVVSLLIIAYTSRTTPPYFRSDQREAIEYTEHKEITEYSAIPRHISLS